MTPEEVAAVLNDPSLPNVPQVMPGHSGTVAHVDPTKARERRAAMSAALAQGASRDAIVATFTAKYGMNEGAVLRLKAEVTAMWAEEDAESIKLSRGAARRRILGHIHSASKDRKWTAVAALEKVLSDVEGTVAPEVQDPDHDNPTARIMEVVLQQMSLTDPTQMRILIDRERVLIQSSKGEPDLRPQSILMGDLARE